MSAPFKMKGSQNLGHGNQHSSSKGMPYASPVKKHKKEKKSTSSGSSVYDKITQLGQGAKGFMKELGRSTKYGQRKDPWNEAVNSYNREKSRDEGTKKPKKLQKRSSGSF